MIFVTGLAIITSVYPSHARGKAIGINVTTVYIALSPGGPSWGGFMTDVPGVAEPLFLPWFPWGARSWPSPGEG